MKKEPTLFQARQQLFYVYVPNYIISNQVCEMWEMDKDKSFPHNLLFL